MIDGQRESVESWRSLLLDLRDRGLAEPPKLATGDGSLGFWRALAQVFPSTVHERCMRCRGHSRLLEITHFEPMKTTVNPLFFSELRHPGLEPGTR